MLAQLTANFVNAHLKKGAPAKTIKEFMPYLSVWPDENGYSDVDKEVLENLL